jgi:hypothetical protein
MAAHARAALILTLLLPACVDDAAGRTRMAFDVLVAGADVAPALPTAGARAIRLDVARLHLGGLAFFEGDALLARRSVVEEILSFPTARAHPGHSTPGEALADTVVIGVIDLLSPGPTTITADGLSGAYGSLTVPLVGGETLRLEGALLGDDADQPFRAVLDLTHELEGIPCVVDEMEGRRLRLDVRVPELVRRIDTDLLPSSDATVDLTATPQAENALTRALKAQTTFRITVEDAP